MSDIVLVIPTIWETIGGPIVWVIGGMGLMLFLVGLRKMTMPQRIVVHRQQPKIVISELDSKGRAKSIHSVPTQCVPRRQKGGSHGKSTRQGQARTRRTYGASRSKVGW